MSPIKSYAVVLDVVNGLYGNGRDRKMELTYAGYDYDKVQKDVDEYMGNEYTKYHTICIYPKNGSGPLEFKNALEISKVNGFLRFMQDGPDAETTGYVLFDLEDIMGYSTVPQKIRYRQPTIEE